MKQAIYLPALRGVVGDWVYYIALMKFGTIADRIKRTEEVHKSKFLRDMIQRQLTPRSKVIAKYIQSQPQRFFNAIVIGLYGANPEWNEITIRESKLFNPGNIEESVENSLGILKLTGKESLFAIDGQHRVEGIKEYIKSTEKPNLTDEVCVIFVSHKTTPNGIQRTRRLFSTLNRYAKPVSMTEIIALDEDDVIAIVCRELLDTHPLLSSGRVSLNKQKSLSANDDKNITSLIALYQAMDIYLRDKKNWKDFKKTRPEEEIVAAYLKRAKSFWDTICASIPELQRVLKLKPADRLPSDYRGAHGGDLLFRPMALPLIARCASLAIKGGLSESSFFSKFAKVPRKLSAAPWMGLIWDGENMITNKKSSKLAGDLILYLIGATGPKHKLNAEILKERLAVVLGKDKSEITLPAKIQ